MITNSKRNDEAYAFGYDTAFEALLGTPVEHRERARRVWGKALDFVEFGGAHYWGVKGMLAAVEYLAQFDQEQEERDA